MRRNLVVRSRIRHIKNQYKTIFATTFIVYEFVTASIVGSQLATFMDFVTEKGRLEYRTFAGIES